MQKRHVLKKLITVYMIWKKYMIIHIESLYAFLDFLTECDRIIFLGNSTVSES